MSKKESLYADDHALNADLDKYEVGTLHSIISSLRQKYEASTKNNAELKKSVDNLSAELGKIKRKLKRKENK